MLCYFVICFYKKLKKKKKICFVFCLVFCFCFLFYFYLLCFCFYKFTFICLLFVFDFWFCFLSFCMLVCVILLCFLCTCLYDFLFFFLFLRVLTEQLLIQNNRSLYISRPSHWRKNKVGSLWASAYVIMSSCSVWVVALSASLLALFCFLVCFFFVFVFCTLILFEEVQRFDNVIISVTVWGLRWLYPLRSGDDS